LTFLVRSGPAATAGKAARPPGIIIPAWESRRAPGRTRGSHRERRRDRLDSPISL
jgi:hypothetical protein